jgi:hypothetical protein
LFSLERGVDASSALFDFDRKRAPCFLDLLPRLAASAARSDDSADLPEPVRWPSCTMSDRLSGSVSMSSRVRRAEYIPSELGVLTGRLRSGVDEPLLPLAYREGDGSEGCWRVELSLRRDDDLLAEKLEKMFFESFLGFGDAGDWGMLWNGALGEANSGMLGDLGLVGLMGALFPSLRFLVRMARDSVDDLGIFLRGLSGGSQG